MASSRALAALAIAGTAAQTMTYYGAPVPSITYGVSGTSVLIATVQGATGAAPGAALPTSIYELYVGAPNQDIPTGSLPTGTYVSQLDLPGTCLLPANGAAAGRTYPAEGILTNTYNGTMDGFALLPCYGAVAAGDGSVDLTASKTIITVGKTTPVRATAFTGFTGPSAGPYTGLRSAASQDGQNFYVAGGGGGTTGGVQFVSATAAGGASSPVYAAGSGVYGATFAGGVGILPRYASISATTRTGLLLVAALSQSATVAGPLVLNYGSYATLPGMPGAAAVTDATVKLFGAPATEAAADAGAALWAFVSDPVQPAEVIWYSQEVTAVADQRGTVVVAYVTTSQVYRTAFQVSGASTVNLPAGVVDEPVYGLAARLVTPTAGIIYAASPSHVYAIDAQSRGASGFPPTVTWLAAAPSGTSIRGVALPPIGAFPSPSAPPSPSSSTTPPPTYSTTMTATQTSSATPTRTSTGTVTATATSSYTPYPTVTATGTATSTVTATGTATSTLTATGSHTMSVTPSNLYTPSYTSSPTLTPPNTATPTSTATATATSTSSTTATATSTSSTTPATTTTPTPAYTPSRSVSRTASSSPSAPATPTPTQTQNVAFMPWSILVLRLDNGATLATGTLSALHWDEITWWYDYNPAHLVQSVAITAPGGSCTLAPGHSTWLYDVEGLPSNSADRSLALTVCYNTPPSDPALCGATAPFAQLRQCNQASLGYVANAPGSSNSKTITTIDWLGIVRMTTVVPAATGGVEWAQGSGIRQVATVDGTAFWIAVGSADNSGFMYVPSFTADAPAIRVSGGAQSPGQEGFHSPRGVGVYGGMLYGTAGTADNVAFPNGDRFQGGGIFAIGQGGLPTSSVTSALLPYDPTATMTSGSGVFVPLAGGDDFMFTFVFKSPTSVWVAASVYPSSTFLGVPIEVTTAGNTNAGGVIELQLAGGVWSIAQEIAVDANFPVYSIMGRWEPHGQSGYEEPGPDGAPAFWFLYAATENQVYAWTAAWGLDPVYYEKAPGTTIRGIVAAPQSPTPTPTITATTSASASASASSSASASGSGTPSSSPSASPSGSPSTTPTFLTTPKSTNSATRTQSNTGTWTPSPSGTPSASTTATVFPSLGCPVPVEGYLRGACGTTYDHSLHPDAPYPLLGLEPGCGVTTGGDDRKHVYSFDLGFWA